MNQKLEELLNKENKVESSFRARLYQSCNSCRKSPSTGLVGDRTLCQYCLKFEQLTPTGLAQLDLAAGKMVQLLSTLQFKDIRLRVQNLIEEKIKQLIQLRTQLLQRFVSKQIAGLQLVEVLVNLKEKMAKGGQRILVINELKKVNQQFRQILLYKKIQKGQDVIMENLKLNLLKVGQIIDQTIIAFIYQNKIKQKKQGKNLARQLEICPLKNNLLERPQRLTRDTFKTYLKSRQQNVGKILQLVKIKDNRTVIGCKDGLYFLNQKGRHLLLGGGYILGLAINQDGAIYGSSTIANFNIFTLDQNLKVIPLVEKAPLFQGFSVQKNKIYYTTNEYQYKVKVLQNGETQVLMSSDNSIYALACYKNSLFIGEQTKVSHIDEDGKVTTVLTQVEGVNLNAVSGLCVCKNHLFISDYGNKRVVAAKIEDDKLTCGRQVLVQGVKFNKVMGLYSTGREIFICDCGTQTLTIIQLSEQQ